jgi:SAM-dependent methyltransferase
MIDPNPPLFALTSDVDWAPEFCIRDFIEFARAYGIRPTIFATHESATVREAGEAGAAQVGVHPNFLPGSTHGSDILSVIDHVCALYPQAKCFRSHSFVDGSPITRIFRARGFKYDSNLLTYFEEDLRPIRHGSGVMRLPVFWEDDTHWNQGGSWDLDAYYDHFLSPGLKIINVHPIHFALNTPSNEFYQDVRRQVDKWSGEAVERLRYDGKGTRTFVSELTNRLRQSQFEFHTMHDLYERFATRMHIEQSADAGRTSKVTDEQHNSYWQKGDAERQQILRDQYSQRNAIDPYATSRDYNQRELEIVTIANAMQGERRGRGVDFGCGNGYTLLSLAKKLSGWTFEGVDFSQHLIDGANVLRAEAINELQSDVVFHCGDAVSRITELASCSLDAVITERFLLNLPSKEAQRGFIRQVARKLRIGGLFLMCEGSMEGFRGLNRLRTAIGIGEIAETGTGNLSAIRFEDHDIDDFVGHCGFEIVQKQGFSYFFAMSRALHPALIYPQTPKFKSQINDIARQLQMQLPFAPGIGSNVLWVLRKKA